MPARRYTDDEKQHALTLYKEQGMAAAAAITGIPKGTLASWVHRTGAHTYANERTAAAIETRKTTLAARRLVLIDRLSEVAEKAVERQLALIDTSDDLRAVVGAGTRAIHDVQLLTGEATERPEHMDTASPLNRVLERMADLGVRMRQAEAVLDAPSAEAPVVALPDEGGN